MSSVDTGPTMGCMRGMRKPLRWRTIRAVLADLCMGFALTVATVCAGAAVSDSSPTIHASYPPNPPVTFSEQFGLGVTRRYVSPRSSAAEVLQLIPADWFARTESIADATTYFATCKTCECMETRAGWPMRCAVGSACVGIYPALRFSTHWAIPAQLPTLSQPFVRIIPYRPLWTGLLIDVALWSVAAWAISQNARVCRAVRGIWRCRAGLCPACAYPTRGIRGPCPECGNASLARSA